MQPAKLPRRPSLAGQSSQFVRAAAITLVLASSGCASNSQLSPATARSGAAPNAPGAAETEREGAKRLDAFELARALGRGINLGNALEAPREGDWGVTLTERDFQLVSSAGFDHIRLPVRWSAHAGEQEPYRIDEAFAQRVKWAVDTALANELRVVLNVHHYEQLMQDPARHRPRLVGLWRQISQAYAAYPEQLYFELINEPNGAMGRLQTNQILAEVIAAVRESSPHRMLVVGPSNWCKIDALDALELPADDEGLIVTFHYYEPHRFTHQGAPSANLQDQVGTEWPGSIGGLDEMSADFARAAEWSRTHARPLYLGEFGTYQAAPLQARKRWTAAVVKLADQHQMSYAYWELRAGFGAYDPARNAWRKELLEAILPDHRVPASMLVVGEAIPSAS